MIGSNVSRREPLGNPTLTDVDKWGLGLLAGQLSGRVIEGKNWSGDPQWQGTVHGHENSEGRLRFLLMEAGLVTLKPAEQRR